MLLLLITSCKKTPNGPVDNPLPGRRDYIWTIDTIKYPDSYQTCMTRIWGSSSTNLYIAGFNDVSRGQMWHYAGKKWEPVKLTVDEGGTIQRGFYLTSIFGLSANNIWAIGYRMFGLTSETDSCLIIHFDGAQWTELPIYSGSPLIWGWGINSSDIWIGGVNGTLFHYNGVQWKNTNFRPDIGIYSIYGTDNNDVYLIGDQWDSRQGDSIYNFLYHYDGLDWKLVDSVSEAYSPMQRNSVWALDKGNVYIAGNGIYRKNGSSWEKVLVANTSFSMIRGTSSSNLFAVGLYSSVYHYNGLDWQKFEQINYPSINFTDVWTDGKEVFILGTDGLTTYVVHGK
jgi:hypothetical protein